MTKQTLVILATLATLFTAVSAQTEESSKPSDSSYTLSMTSSTGQKAAQWQVHIQPTAFITTFRQDYELKAEPPQTYTANTLRQDYQLEAVPTQAITTLSGDGVADDSTETGTLVGAGDCIHPHGMSHSDASCQ